jgi:hypothetical protein
MSSPTIDLDKYPQQNKGGSDMCARYRLIYVAIVLAVIQLIALIAGCRCPPDCLTPAPAPVQPAPASTQPHQAPVASVQQAPAFQELTGIDIGPERPVDAANPYFVKNQVIVTGNHEEIDPVLKSAGVTMTPVATITLSELKLQQQALLATEIRLYQIEPVSTVLEVVGKINATSYNLSKTVFADPNYLTGHPVTVGVSPWDIGSEPWDIGSELADKSGLGASGGLFWSQWALNTGNGISVFAAPDISSRTVVTQGDGVLVGVFDTSPFSHGGTQSVNGVLTPALNLWVSHPQEIPKRTESDDNYPDVSSHGLFVAGLVHAVAPKSQIHLVRTLNDKGQGDTFWLLKNLVEFVKRAPSAYRGLVINLSLGVHTPSYNDYRTGTKLTDDQIKWLKDNIRAPEETWATVDTPVAALEVTLRLLTQDGAVIAAAAGNDSAGQSVQPMQIPASYPFVIGVAASNYDRGLACFSNKGDVAAPGGNGLANCTPPFSKCSDANVDCPCQSGMDCQYGVLSLVKTSDGIRFAHWLGTSFATPLVSGQAALLRSAGVAPSEVYSRIAVSASDPSNCSNSELGLGCGIINIPNSLSTPTQ